ncbi:hypothetical protein CPC08DRAFT_56823 [Agrocybe pediades]|nr:hypothetical protein CPC08DRAFT_56823 [Agrocybe pediades]
MPRIIPRLLEKIERQANQLQYFDFKLPKKGGLSLYKRVPPQPSFHPRDHERSILLSPGSPVTESKRYARHKRMPPSQTKPGAVDTNLEDSPRQMKKEEFGWFGNPYLRMLSSPIRNCLVTKRLVPSDLLIRLVGMRPTTSRVPEGRKVPAKLVPDGLLHPKYANRRVSGGCYVLCWRGAVRRLEKSGYKRVSTELTIPTNLEQHIAHLLRVRILQEFELLAERLEYAARKGTKKWIPNVILRRLTREEWGAMRTTGTLPYTNALALLIVPPVNKDVITKTRPQSSMSPLPPQDEHLPKNPPPTSVFLTGPNDFDDTVGVDLPPRQIPLYNSVSAFPSRAQRAALHSLLLRILAAERTHKRLTRQKTPHVETSSSKGSHAFLLCSDAETGRRGDPAAVAMALWRLRMYDSEGWAGLV